MVSQPGKHYGRVPDHLHGPISPIQPELQERALLAKAPKGGRLKADFGRIADPMQVFFSSGVLTTFCIASAALQ